MHRPRGAGLVGALVLAGALVGCTGPRVVSGATSRGDIIKFAWWQKSFGSPKYGIVECKALPDGTLTECTDMKINFKENPK